MKKVVVVALDNCLTSTVVGVLDVLGIANSHWQQIKGKPNNYFDLVLATITGNAVHSFNAIPVVPSLAINDIKQADLVIIPPIMGDIDGALDANQKLIPWLIKMHDRGGVVASICTGVFFLAETGLLDNKMVTTNPLVASMLHQRYPKITLSVDRVLIDEGQILTSGPTYAFVDLAIYFVERYCGFDTALWLSKLLLHDKNRTVQSPYFSMLSCQSHNDEDITKIEDWIRHNYDSQIRVGFMAQKIHMGKRNFVRRFKESTGETPVQYLQKIRINAAKQQLENTRVSIEEITRRVGYTDTKSFRQLFKKFTSLSPSEYRRRFGHRIV